MESKFACQHCGLCCSRVSLDVKEVASDTNRITAFPSFAKNGFVLFCNKPSLPLFDWEAEKLLHLAKKNNLSLTIVPYQAVYDKKSKRAIILQYTFLEKDCPFHSNNRCSMYLSRPLICRSFPSVNGGLANLLTDKLHIRVSGCPNDLDKKEWENLCRENPGKLKFIKSQLERYGDSYLAKLELDRMQLDLNRIMKELIDAGKIEVVDAHFKPEIVLKIIQQAKQVPVTVFLQEMGLMDSESTKELIASIYEYKWAKAIVEKWLFV